MWLAWHRSDQMIPWRKACLMSVLVRHSRKATIMSKWEHRCARQRCCRLMAFCLFLRAQTSSVMKGLRGTLVLAGKTLANCPVRASRQCLGDGAKDPVPGFHITACSNCPPINSLLLGSFVVFWLIGPCYRADLQNDGHAVDVLLGNLDIRKDIGDKRVTLPGLGDKRTR